MANYKRWTHEEDIVLMSLISQAGKANGFKKAAEELGRTIDSCRSRYYNHLDYKDEEDYKPFIIEDKEENPKKGFWYSIIHLFKRSK